MGATSLCSVERHSYIMYTLEAIIASLSNKASAKKTFIRLINKDKFQVKPKIRQLSVFHLNKLINHFYDVSTIVNFATNELNLTPILKELYETPSSIQSKKYKHSVLVMKFRNLTSLEKLGFLD